MADTEVPPQDTEKFEMYVGAYVKLRDQIKEKNDAHAKTMEADLELQNQLTAWLTSNLERVGAESIKTKNGTVYTTTRYSASLADPQAFMEYVKSTDNFDLLDRKANATAVRDHVKEQGSLPPGANLSAIRTVGVRRAPGT